jgi:hypothetical protein
MRHLLIINGILSLTLFSGCHICCWGKRASENECPTDIRKTHYWCLGEDAVFHYPCGPDPEFYGHQPTCWREWPTSAAEWRDLHCQPAFATGEPCKTEIFAVPTMTAPPVESNSVNPFRENVNGNLPSGEVTRLPGPGLLAPPEEPLPTLPKQNGTGAQPLPSMPIEGGSSQPNY